MGIVRRCLLLVALAGCGRDPIEVEVTILGGSLRGRGNAEAFYQASRPILFVNRSVMGPRMHTTSPSAWVDEDRLIARVPRALTSLSGWRLRSLRLKVDDEAFPVAFSFLEDGPTTAPPSLGSSGEGGTPLEFAVPEGGVARFSASSAYLPSISVAGPEIERVEVEIDPSPVPVTAILRDPEVLGWKNWEHLRSQARFGGREVWVEPDTTVPVPFGRAVATGWPSQWEWGASGSSGALVVDEQLLLDEIGWKQKMTYLPLTRSELESLQSQPSSLLRARVVEQEGVLAAELAIPPGSRGTAALLIYSELPGSEVVGAAYMRVVVGKER